MKQVRQERKISYDITYMWNGNRNDTNELTYKKRLTDLGNKFRVAAGKG